MDARLDLLHNPVAAKFLKYLVSAGRAVSVCASERRSGSSTVSTAWPAIRSTTTTSWPSQTPSSTVKAGTPGKVCHYRQRRCPQDSRDRHAATPLEDPQAQLIAVRRLLKQFVGDEPPLLIRMSSYAIIVCFRVASDRSRPSGCSPERQRSHR